MYNDNIYQFLYMQLKNIITKFKNFIIFDSRVATGRWNINDNKAIKETLANMDSCGDNLCGNPVNYNKIIRKILKEGKAKIDL